LPFIANVPLVGTFRPTNGTFKVSNEYENDRCPHCNTVGAYHGFAASFTGSEGA